MVLVNRRVLVSHSQERHPHELTDDHLFFSKDLVQLTTARASAFSEAGQEASDLMHLTGVQS